MVKTSDCFLNRLVRPDILARILSVLLFAERRDPIFPEVHWPHQLSFPSASLLAIQAIKRLLIKICQL